MAFDPKHLPEDPKILQQIVLDLMAQLDRESSERTKIETLLRELLDSKRNRQSEQLSVDQLALFAAAWEKSTARASLPAQVIVTKNADHLPLHRHEKIFERHDVDISRKTVGGWLAQCAPHQVRLCATHLPRR